MRNVVGNGLMVTLIDEETIKTIKKGSLKEFPDFMKVITEDGLAFGIVVELEMTKSDYEKAESFVVCNFKRSSTDQIKSGFENKKNMPVYSFEIKKR